MNDIKENMLTKAVVVGGMGLVCRHNGTEYFSSLEGFFGICLFRRYFNDVV